VGVGKDGREAWRGAGPEEDGAVTRTCREQSPGSRKSKLSSSIPILSLLCTRKKKGNWWKDEGRERREPGGILNSLCLCMIQEEEGERKAVVEQRGADFPREEDIFLHSAIAYS
jgi:hypothetical protein